MQKPIVEVSPEIHRLERELAKAQRASTRASERRAALPAGTSRARVTSANARWMRAAEYRDLIAKQLAEARAKEASA